MNKTAYFIYQLDDFEEIVITGPNAMRLPGCQLHEGGKSTDHLGKESLTLRDPDNAVCHSELEGVCSQDNPQTSGTACIKFSWSFMNKRYSQK